MPALFTVIKAVALAAYLILALLTLRSGAERRVRTLFFSILVGMMLWQLGSLMASVARTEPGALFWYNFVVAASGLFNALFLPFTRSIVGIKKQRVLSWAAYVWCFLLPLLVLLGIQFRTAVIGRGGYYVLEFDNMLLVGLSGVVYFFWGAGVVNLVRGLRREPSAAQRNRIRYLLLGALVIISGTLTNLTVLRDYPVDIALNVVAAGVIAYGVVRHRLLDIRVVLVRGLFYSLLTGLLIVLYLLLLVGLQRLLSLQSGLAAPGYAVIAVVVVGLVFMPVRNLLQRGIDRLFFRQRYDYQKVMESYSRSAASLHDPVRLLELVVDAVRETVKVDRLLITLRSADNTRYTVEKADGRNAGAFADYAIRESHPLVRWLERHGEAVLREEIGRTPELVALRDEAEEIFQGTDASVLVPIVSKGHLAGVFHVGRKLSGAIFNQEDLRFLTTVANQTATALDNAFVYRELERRLAERTLLLVLSETFRRRLDFESILQSAAEVLRDFLNLGYCLLVWVRAGRAVVFCAGTRAEGMRPTVEHIATSWLERMSGVTSETQETVDLRELARRVGVSAPGDLQAVEAHECVQLRQAGEALGMIVFPQAPPTAHRSEGRADLIRAVASILAQAMMLNRSISDLQEMKSYNDSIINSMASCVVVVDAEMRITTANRAARRFAGLPDEEGPSARLIGKALPEAEILGQLASLVSDALRAGRTYQSRETHVRLRDQRSVPIGISTSVLSVEDEARGAVVIFTDLSEIKQLETQLFRSEKLASIGRLAAGVSHELRNPLGSIAGYAELIQERIRSEDEVVRRGLRTILSESERSRRIIESLLDYARVKEPRFYVVEVQRVIEDTVPLVERELSQHRIRLDRDYRDGGACIRADREQMREVLINLVLNAQQATSGEGKSITVLTRREEGRVLVSVTDQGCGIPADNVDKLFDPFFTTKTDGTGLGLSIVHRIVEAHDGLVYVDSTPGVGSSFTISLPAAVPVAATVG